MSDWQPIETAPKVEDHDGLYFRNKILVWSPSGWWEIVYWCGATSQWRSYLGHGKRNPTHWMPLPDPPIIR